MSITEAPICSRCLQALDRHGEHLKPCIPRRAAAPVAVVDATPAPAEKIMRSFKRGDSRQKRMVELVSTDPAQPSTAATIAFLLSMTTARAGVALCIACKDGHIARVARGQYVRAAA